LAETPHSELPAPPPALSGGGGRKRSPGRRALLWLLLLLLGPLALGLVLVALAYLLLHLGPGQRLAARIASEKVSELLQGRLGVGRVEVSGGLRVCLREVSLDDPETGPVLSADSVCLSVAALALAKERAVISGLVLEHPVVDIANVAGKDGKPTTTLARALAARKASAPKTAASGPLAWVIELQALELHHGALRLRPAPGAPPSLALDDLEIKDGKARYAEEGALAKLSLSAQLTAPGKLPAAVELDASLAGAVATGKIALRKLKVALGQTGLSAWGDYDLGTRKGRVELSELRVRPEDLAQLLPAQRGALLTHEVRGKGEVKSDGHRVTVRLSLEPGSGRIELEASATAEAVPEWAIKLQALGVDPSALSPKAPKGVVTVKLDAGGKGVPKYDQEGPLGELRAKLHVGPAHLAGMGRATADLDAHLSGRRGVVRAFTATALGLTLSAHGRAARDAIDLAVEVDAPDLSAVAAAIGALTKKPPSALEGKAHLVARVSGKPLAPDAEVHLRAPRLANSDVLDVTDLAIDGELHGDLRNPREVRPVGKLLVTARHAWVTQIELSRPTMQTNLRWPGAGLDLVADVLGGQFHLRGQARLDDDGDGLIAPELTLAYPGNELKLRSPINIHFRPKSTIVEPFWLEGQHGGLGFSATLHKPLRKGQPGDLDALIELHGFDLARLPAFAMPPDLGLAGMISGRVVVDGRLPHPQVDAHLDLAGGAWRRVRGVELKIFAHLFRDRLRAEVEGSGPAGVHLAFKADAPLASPALVPATSPLNGELVVRDLDLAQAAQLIGDPKLTASGLRGALGLRLAFEGTLGAPRVTASVDASHLSLVVPKKQAEAIKQTTGDVAAHVGSRVAGALGSVGPPQNKPPPPGELRVSEAELHLGLWLERGLVALDGYAALGGQRPITMAAQAPFDALRALREPGYLQGALRRPLRATITAAQVELKELADAGLIPPGTSGKVSGAIQMTGTPMEPLLSITATAEEIASGKLKGLGGTVQLELRDRIKLQATATAGADVLARLEVTLGVSASEWAELRRVGDPKEIARRIAGRQLHGLFEVPGIYLGRAAALAGQEHLPINGRLLGSVKLEGTPGEPSIVGQLALKDVVTRAQRLGHAELYVEGGPAGATLHLGINPPGGGTLLLHATLAADLTARAILENGAVGVLQGQLDGKVTARQLDLGFLSGINPLVRKAAGTLEADVEVKGLLGSPQSLGTASLRNGLFDVVGQGIFHQVGLDASFSPKEVVLDRLVGQLGAGTFSAVLVANRRPVAGVDDGSERLEFTGEIHLGDDESVRERTDEKGKPLVAAPLPIRQAGAERAVVDGEIDLFGSWDRGLLAATAKIPSVNVRILSLPSKKLPSLSPDPDVLLVHPGEKPHPPGIEPEEVEAEALARKTANFRMQLTLDLQHLFVKAEDFEFPVRSNLNFEYDARRPDKPTADGTIAVPNGSFTVFGRRFQIESALITETGGDISDPELEVKARYEKGATVVFINVSGTAKDPVLDLQSNPPMDQDAIAFFLATGRVQGRATQNGGGVDLQGAASSVLGSLLFGQIRKELADVLPVDVLTIEASGTGVAQASVGKYLGDAFFIGYKQRLTPAAPNENTSEGKIEYEVSRSVTAEATIGDRNSDVSILWSKDF
jgi:autotransporter translocation and assembly factor TamB